MNDNGPSPTPPRSMRCNGVGRDAGWPESLQFYFDRAPTDDQMRYLHDVMKRACSCMPKDIADG